MGTHKFRKCSKCGAKLTQQVSMPANHIVNVPGKDLTVYGYICTTCGKFVPAFLKVAQY